MKAVEWAFAYLAYFYSRYHTQTRIGEDPARQSFFAYDNDKDIKVCFLVTHITCRWACFPCQALFNYLYCVCKRQDLLSFPSEVSSQCIFLYSLGCYLDGWPDRALSWVDAFTLTSDCKAPGQVPNWSLELMKCAKCLIFVNGTWTGAMEWHLSEWYPLLL